MSHKPEPNLALPGEKDFDPFGGFLDAQHAWREFGGLSIDDAYLKFIGNPLCFQEDFMFMGGRALAFYFPVLDRYLREYRAGVGPGDADDSYAGIIGAGLCLQFLSPAPMELTPILEDVRMLAAYVQEHVDWLAVNKKERQRIDTDWQVLQTQLLARSGSPPDAG